MTHVSLAITPGGRLLFDAGSLELGAPPPPPPRVAKAVAEAFNLGLGPGLVHLASRQLTTELPPSLGFGRDLGKTYLVALCALSEPPAVGELAPPDGELRDRVEAVPPMAGAEYATLATLIDAWNEIDAYVGAELAAFDGSVHDYVHELNPAYHGIGRVTLHLAEHKKHPATPFAFLATYAEGMQQSGKVRHVPLGKAIEAYRDDRERLLRLLRPVHAAAERNAVVKDLSDSGDLFHPLAWTPAEAYGFLRAIPDCQESGLVVRLPDWWRGRPNRPQVTVSVGASKPSGLGMDAMLDFHPALTLDGDELSAEEQEKLLSGARGLRRLKGRWVEVDPDRLHQALDRFRSIADAATEGVTFAEGMRLLAGTDAAAPEDDLGSATEERAWAGVEAGPWLRATLEQLRRPDGGGADPGEELKGTLRPYQRDGVAWLRLLARLGLGGCLADDMGLGKTIQVISLLLLLRRDGEPGPHLLVVPASLLGNWKMEMGRFAPDVRLLVAHRSELTPAALKELADKPLDDVDVVMTTYATLARLAWLRERRWGLAVLDEAQAIKNPGTRQTRAAKSLRTRMRFALTGTPVENRLGDLWSLFDFLCPGLLGTAKAFTEFSKQLAAEGGPGYAPLRRLLKPYVLRRLKTDPTVVPDLPDKTEMTVYCGLTPWQASLYEEAVTELRDSLEELEGIERRGVVLAFLLRFKQICNHPSQWTGDGGYDASASGKFARLAELCETLAARQERLLVFTQFREMTRPLAGFLAEVFGRPGLILHGQTPVKRRQKLVAEFQTDGGPPFFVLSLKAGGTGLNLTAANHVVHFDRWWNPAVENQATDRAFRIGQHRNVMVHAFVCRGTIEERIDAMLAEKRQLMDEVLAGSAEQSLTEMDTDELVELVSLDITRATAT